jgi:hypothetical protein
MKWISEAEIDAIKTRVTGQTFPDKPTHIYDWYGRFFSLGLAILMGIPFAVDRTPKWACMFIICLIVAYYQNEAWKHYKERFVLKLMLSGVKKE